MTITKNNENKYTIEADQEEIEEMHMWACAETSLREVYRKDTTSREYRRAKDFFKETAKYLRDWKEREKKWGHLF